MGGLEEPPVADLGRLQLAGHPPAVGDVLDGEEDQLVLALRGEAAGVEEHRLRADVLEVVLHLEIVERRCSAGRISSSSVLKRRDVPLPVPQVVEESAFGLGGVDLERLVERAIRRPDVELRVEDEERLPHRRHDALGVFPGRLDGPLGLPAVR